MSTNRFNLGSFDSTFNPKSISVKQKKMQTNGQLNSEREREREREWGKRGNDGYS